LAVYLYIHKQTTPKHTSKGSPSFKVGGTNQGWPAKRVFWAPIWEAIFQEIFTTLLIQ